MRVGVVDIGTNSMRLLITDDVAEIGRWVEVTGLGAGVDTTGELSVDGIDRTLQVLKRFGTQMTVLAVEKRYAMATSATRDASNREEFLDLAEMALGTRPEVISGAREGILAFDGATADVLLEEPVVVSDIGGGSTEVVTHDTVTSVDMGSVRLTDRMSRVYPLPEWEFDRAVDMVWAAFEGIDCGPIATHIGVAATWTSLAAISQDLPRYDRRKVHGYWLTNEDLDSVVDRLCDLSFEELRRIPSLDPKRAPVIRAGALVALAVTGVLGTAETLISVKDSLDGAAFELLGLYPDS
jgi:exopolyphosphatase/guanosine-5'-triphosphate,3'-diphosphate pyrophosphatase